MNKLKVADKYPILRRIVLLQFALFFLALSTLYFGLSLAVDSRREEQLDKRREHFKFLLEPIQEKWRSWYALGLNDNLQADIFEFKKHHDIKKLYLSSREILNQDLNSHILVIPKDPDDLTDSVVVLELEESNEAFFDNLSNEFFWIFLMISIVILGFSMVSAFFIHSKIYTPLKELNDSFERLRPGERLKTDAINASGEIENFLQKTESIYNQKVENDRLAAVGELGRQVAHDIRSPLTALNMLMGQNESMADEEKSLLKQAVNRIESIAGNLLQPTSEKLGQKGDLSAEHIAVLMDEIIREKKVEVSDKPKVKIKSDHINNYGLFGLCDEIELKRIVSNLVNNSIQAMDFEGIVSVKTSRKKGFVQICVCDDGPGMDSEVLDAVQAGQVVSQRQNGNGLGLKHAREAVSKWGGSLIINSTPGQGTTVSITMPVCDPEPWHLSHLNLSQYKEIVLVDDDPSQYEVWMNKLKDAKSLKYFPSFASVENSQDKFSEDTFFLVDYQMSNEMDFTGVDFIRKEKIETRSLLVTSHSRSLVGHSDKELEGIKFLPKNFIESMPLET